MKNKFKQLQRFFVNPLYVMSFLLSLGTCLLFMDPFLIEEGAQTFLISSAIALMITITICFYFPISKFLTIILTIALTHKIVVSILADASVDWFSLMLAAISTVFANYLIFTQPIFRKKMGMLILIKIWWFIRKNKEHSDVK